MVAAKLLLVACSAFSSHLGEGQGSIGGLVVNASKGKVPAGGAEVVLRVELDGRFVPFRETIADAQGQFRFDDLPVGKPYLYLPGANCDDIHYPGPRVQLTAERPHVRVDLAVCNAVSRPNPLVIRRQEIVIRPEPGVLNVTESILVENPTSTCYVGQAMEEGAEPVTLPLAIPSDFERVTFREEFFGRRFSIADAKLVTGIPWMPGQRELTFTYLLPNQQRYRLWQRPLDLPCAHLRLSVQTTKPQEISCNLERVSGKTGESSSQVIFESAQRTLPAGYMIRVELGQLPVPLMAYARWMAVLVLGGLVVAISLIMIGWRSAKPRTADYPRHS